MVSHVNDMSAKKETQTKEGKRAIGKIKFAGEEDFPGGSRVPHPTWKNSDK